MATKSTTGIKIIRKKGFKTVDPELEKKNNDTKSYIMDGKRRNQLRELYASVDVNNDQRLSVGEIQKLFLLINRELTDKEIKQWLEKLGKNSCNFDDFCEFEKKLLDQEKLEDNLNEASLAFTTYDENQKGFITVEELKKILMESGTDTEKFNENEFKKVLELADIREDGIFCYGKFIKEVRLNNKI
jgi:Ca2+-binding EF-hand superfamily protein